MADVIINIDGINRVNYVELKTLKITDELYSKINTASFSVFDETGSFTPTTSMEVEIYDTDSNKIFAGLIAQVEEQRAALTVGDGSELLRYSITCQDYTKLLQKRLVVETFENKTCKQIIQSLVSQYYPTAGITTAGVDDGPTIEEISFNYKPFDKCLDELAKSVGYQWYIDYDKDIAFFQASEESPVMTIGDDTTNWFNLKVRPDTTQVRNRVYVRGGKYFSDPFTQKFVGDGETEEFILAYTPQYEGFTLQYDTYTATIGILNVDDKDNFDFMLNRKEKSITSGNSEWAQANLPIANADTFTCTYNYEIPILVVQEDTESIESLAALEGGDGVYEHVIIDETIVSIPAARARAQAELDEFANPYTVGSVESYDAAGVTSGNLIEINSTRRGINANYLVQRVEISWAYHQGFRYRINFSGKLYNTTDILMSLFRQEEGITVNADEVLDAFNLIRDANDGIEDATPTLTDSAPPFKWSNDAGTTTNKMRWSLFEWD